MMLDEDLSVELLGDRKQSVKWIESLFNADTSRISSPRETMYAIAGWHRDSTYDIGEWTKNGKPVGIEYTEEYVVGNGEDFQVLRRDVRDHKRIMIISMEDYIEENLGVEVPNYIYG